MMTSVHLVPCHFHFLHSTISSARQQLHSTMLAVPDNTLVTRSRSRERRARGGDSGQEEKEEEQEERQIESSLGLGLPVAGFLQLRQEGPATPGLLSNLKGSPRSRSRGGNGERQPVRRSPRRNLGSQSPCRNHSHKRCGGAIKKVAFKTRTTVLSIGGTENEVGS